MAVPFFLTIWQAIGTTCLYHPHHIGNIRYVYLSGKRCGKYVLSVERKAYFVCLEKDFRQTDKEGMMCNAYGGQPRQEDSISSQMATEISLK